MYLDAYASDAAWLGRYALNRSGEVIPWQVIADGITATQPYDVFMLRGMIAVPYFEKALYELPESELTVERLLALADEVETRVQGGLSPRPLLSVPHPLSDESSCYYHGYGGVGQDGRGEGDGAYCSWAGAEAEAGGGDGHGLGLACRRAG
ncbi:hypothetical protein TSOC_014818, partial [Tetrabaena socialis]